MVREIASGEPRESSLSRNARYLPDLRAQMRNVTVLPPPVSGGAPPGPGGPMIRVLRLFRRNRSGATAIEYGLVAAGISVAIIGALTLVGSEIQSTFTTIAAAVDNAVQN